MRFVLPIALIVMCCSVNPMVYGRGPTTFVASHNVLVKEQIEMFTLGEKNRRDIISALARLKQKRGLLKETARRYGVPIELAALAVIESRYRNLPAAANRSGCCAGLWQLHWITARDYGLKVEGEVDERLDPHKATDAAMRHLADLYRMYGSWEVAILAYNLGQARLARIMRETGVKDPWELVRGGHSGKFLSKVMAVIHIMEQPDLLNDAKKVVTVAKE